MSNLLQRFTASLRRGVEVLLTPAADPRQTFADAGERQHQLLARVRQSLAENAAARTRLHHSAAQLRARGQHLEDRARQALQLKREDLARLALQQRQATLAEHKLVNDQLQDVGREESRLTLLEQRLTAQMETWRTRQEVVAARYSAAEAQVRLTEAFQGLSTEWADWGAELEQVEAKADYMQARATAIDQLVNDGVLNTTPDPLAALPLEMDTDLEAQLLALKQEVGAG